MRKQSLQTPTFSLLRSILWSILSWSSHSWFYALHTGRWVSKSGNYIEIVLLLMSLQEITGFKSQDQTDKILCRISRRMNKNPEEGWERNHPWISSWTRCCNEIKTSTQLLSTSLILELEWLRRIPIDRRSQIMALHRRTTNHRRCLLNGTGLLARSAGKKPLDLMPFSVVNKYSNTGIHSNDDFRSRTP